MWWVLVAGGPVFLLGRAVGRRIAPEPLHEQPWSRILPSLAAAPAANLVAVVLVPWLLLWVASGGMVPAPVVGSVGPGEEVRPGDRIVAIGGRPVRTWADVQAALDAGAVEVVLERGPARVKRPDQVWHVVDLPVVAVDEGSPLARAGVPQFAFVGAVDGRPVPRWDVLVSELKRAGQEVRLELVPDGSIVVRREAGEAWGHGSLQLTVGGIEPGSAAAEAGLVQGDRLVAIDGRRLSAWSEVGDAVRGSSGSLQLEVSRGGEALVVDVTPRMYGAVRLLGIRQVDGLRGAGVQEQDWVAAAGDAGRATFGAIAGWWSMLRDVVQGVYRTRVVGGPVAGVGRDPLRSAALVFLSAQLSFLVFAALPVTQSPTLRLIEVIVSRRRGRPVSLQRAATWVVGVPLVLLVVAVTVSDVLRWLEG